LGQRPCRQGPTGSSPDPLAGFKGVLLREGREGEGKVEKEKTGEVKREDGKGGREGKREGRGGEMRKGKSPKIPC